MDDPLTFQNSVNGDITVRQPNAMSRCTATNGAANGVPRIHLGCAHEQHQPSMPSLLSRLLRRDCRSSWQWRRLPGDEFPALGGPCPSVEEQQLKTARLTTYLSFDRRTAGN